MTRLLSQGFIFQPYSFDNSIPIPSNEVISPSLIEFTTKPLVDEIYTFLDQLPIEVPKNTKVVETKNGIQYFPDHSRTQLRICDVNIPDEFVEILGLFSDNAIAKQKTPLPLNLWSVMAHVASGGIAVQYYLGDLNEDDIQGFLEFNEIKPQEKGFYFPFKDISELDYLVTVFSILHRSGGVERYDHWINSIVGNDRHIGWTLKTQLNNHLFSIRIDPTGKMIKSFSFKQTFSTIPWRNYDTKIKFNGSKIRSIWHEAPVNSLFIDNFDPNNYYPFWIAQNYTSNSIFVPTMDYPFTSSLTAEDWEQYLAKVDAGEEVISGRTGKLVRQTRSQAIQNLRRWRDHRLNVMTQVLSVRRSSRPPYQFRAELGYRQASNQQHYIRKGDQHQRWLTPEETEKALATLLGKGIYGEYQNTYIVEG